VISKPRVGATHHSTRWITPIRHLLAPALLRLWMLPTFMGELQTIPVRMSGRAVFVIEVVPLGDPERHQGREMEGDRTIDIADREKHVVNRPAAALHMRFQTSSKPAPRSVMTSAFLRFLALFANSGEKAWRVVQWHAVPRMGSATLHSACARSHPQAAQGRPGLRRTSVDGT